MPLRDQLITLKTGKESSSSQDFITLTGFQGNHNLLYRSTAVNTSERMTELESCHLQSLTNNTSRQLSLNAKNH